ncbi:cytoplasmic copper homeostasis protein cutC [Streptomyces sp. L-9-10]|uniref:copper homeostasis protein CutC n=1 Tax=Streptomyces sp. L-9-10 TaxID=1478131 RepID=UPI00101BCED7|nr:copper homeostasis protein CutC [Streptomyces sp. L-9-10]RYJ25794.1 cytoplasmic copper homeostasis protein cutC [Streptomyces sp. L-9-10]
MTGHITGPLGLPRAGGSGHPPAPVAAEAAGPGRTGPAGPVRRPALEIAVTSPAGARVALDHGADRVELCTGLELGGLTPSAALVEAVAAVGLPVQVLVRCRPGDFVHDAEEVALMTAEVRSVIASGASGVVVGALTADGGLDTDAVTRLAAAAHDAGRPVEVTLHRAIDLSIDPVATAALLPALGLTRVLTSGGAPAAGEGLAALAAMVDAAPGVQVMAGGGVRPAGIPALTAAGVAAVHLSAKRRAEPRRGGAWIPLGASSGSAEQDTHFVTDPTVVAEARRMLESRATG